MGAVVRRTPASRRSRATARRRGFTLIELMVALILLSIGILAVAALMPVGGRTMTRARRLTSGTLTASQKVEDLKALPWTDAALAAGTHTDAVGHYTRSWTIADNVPITDVKKVTVTVTWASQGQTRSTAVITYIPRLGT